MRNVIVPLVFLFLSFPAYAQEAKMVVAYESSSSPVSSTLDLDAEYVAMEVVLASTADTPVERLMLTQQLIEAIKLAATKDLSFEFEMGDVSAPPLDMSTVVPKASSTSYYIFTLLRPESNKFAATQAIHKFLEQVKKPGKTSITTGEVGLAVNDPEKYRDRLLFSIKKDIEKMKGVLGTSSVVTITGLENPVYLRKKDDKKISVFLDYKISLGL